MHGNYRRLTWWEKLFALFGRNKGIHKAPRGGDPFPTGPLPMYERDPFAHMALNPPPPQRRYPRGPNPYPTAPNAETMVDLQALTGRPYLNPILTGSER